MTNQRGFVFAFDSDYETGRMATLAIKSIRKWGGQVKDCPIYIIDCGLYKNQRGHFEDMGVTVLPLPEEWQITLPLQYAREQGLMYVMGGLCYAMTLDVPETLLLMGTDCLVIGDVSPAFEAAENNPEGMAVGNTKLPASINVGNWDIFCRNGKSVDEKLLTRRAGYDWDTVKIKNTGSLVLTRWARDKLNNRVPHRLQFMFWLYGQEDWLRAYNVFGADQLSLSLAARYMTPAIVSDLDNCHRLVAQEKGLAFRFGTGDITLGGEKVRYLHLSGPCKPYSPGASVIPITQAYLGMASQL